MGSFSMSCSGEANEAVNITIQHSSRREQRMAIKFSIWAPSPTEEELRNRSPSPDREVKKKPASKSKSKKNGMTLHMSSGIEHRPKNQAINVTLDMDLDSDSDGDSDDSRSDRKRRHKSSKSRKEKKSSRHKSSRKSSGRSSKRRRHYSSEDESEDDRKSSRRDKRRDSRSVSPSHRSSRAERDTEDKKAMVSNTVSRAPEPEMEFPDDMWVEKKVEMPEDDMEVGPVPIHLGDNKMSERSYGGALLAGEGSAMAAYVQDGKRIPRRGEIGLESDQIENYEHAGFVMSGSR